MKFKKTYRPYGVLLVTAEIDGKTVIRQFKSGITDTEIEKAFAANTAAAPEAPVVEAKKGAKK